MKVKSSKSEKLTRRVLDKLPRESLHRARNWSKADVSLAEWPPASGQRVVIKDLQERPLWFRVAAGRALLRREWRALRALRDVAGVPKPIARPDADSIVMAHCEGKQIETLAPDKVPPGTVAKLAKLIAEMHQRGVTHGDLHGYNVLVSEAGEVALIDWATASVFGPQPRSAKKLTFEEWRALDERALAKIKITHDPVGITSRQRELLLEGGSRLYRFVKKFKHLREAVRGLDEDQRREREARQEHFRAQLDEYYRPEAEEK